MKSFEKLFILILLISLIGTGCKKSTKDILNQGNNTLKEKLLEVEEILQQAEQVDVEDTIRKIRPKIIDPFLKNFSSDVTVEDISLYIKDNIANASKDEADKMIQWLIIYQNEITDTLYNRIEDDKYKNVFYDHMEGFLDKSKIDTISDESVRNDFMSLVNSFLTIYYYYENLVIETNWSDLIQFTPYLSDDMSKIINLSKKLDYYEYDREGLDVDGLSKDIITLEKIAKTNKSDFIKWKANDLCRSLMVTLLLGPENVYLFYYDGKEGDEYIAIMDLVNKYPESILKGIIEELDLIPEDDTWAAIEIIHKRFQFGLDSDNFIKISKIESQNGEYELIEMFMPSNVDKQNRVNNIISLDQEQFIKSLAEDNNFSLYTFITFANDRYISFGCSLSVLDSRGAEETFHAFKTLDYIEEKFITLEDYFDADFIFIQEYIENLSGIKAETVSEFKLTDSGIDIHLNKGTDDDEWIYVNRIELIQYFTLGELIDKYY